LESNIKLGSLCLLKFSKRLSSFARLDREFERISWASFLEEKAMLLKDNLKVLRSVSLESPSNVNIKEKQDFKYPSVLKERVN